MKDRSTISAYLLPEDYEKLKQLARDEKRSISKQVDKIITQYLANIHLQREEENAQESSEKR